MIFIDGAGWPPSLHGTEDYFNTAWCPQQEYSAPYHGITLGGGDSWSGEVSLYRFHVEDSVAFERSIRVAIEHGHANKRSDDYSSVFLPKRSRSQSLYLLQEVDVRLIGDSCLLHRLPQVIGVGEPPGVLQTIPLEEYHELVRVVGVAQDPPSLGAASLSGGSAVVVEYRLPPLVVLHFMANKQVKYDVYIPLSERGLADASMMPLARPDASLRMHVCSGATQRKLPRTP